MKNIKERVLNQIKQKNYCEKQKDKIFKRANLFPLYRILCLKIKLKIRENPEQ